MKQNTLNINNKEYRLNEGKKNKYITFVHIHANHLE